jgi:hypothetical protein
MLETQISNIEKEILYLQNNKTKKIIIRKTLSRMEIDYERIRNLKVKLDTLKQCQKETDEEINRLKRSIRESMAELARQHYETQKSELIEKIRLKIKAHIGINGNLSSRIIETSDGEFEHKHDYVLNDIACEIVDEILDTFKQEEKKE